MASVPYQSDSEWIAYGIEWRWTKEEDPNAPWSWFVQDNKWEDECRVTTSPYCFQWYHEAEKFLKNVIYRHHNTDRREYRIIEFEYLRIREVV